MNPKDNKEDIEELNFDDVELEIKLDNNDLKLDLELDNDNSGTKTSSDSNLNEPSNSTESESNESHTNETPSQDALGSEDLPDGTGGNDSSDNTPSENDDSSSSPDNNLNDESGSSEENDESLPDEDNQEVGDNTSKEDGKEEKKDTETKDENDDKKSDDKKDEKSDDNKDMKSDDNKDTNADDKKESDNKNDKEDNKEDSKKNPNELDDKNSKGDNKPKDKENNNGVPNKDNNEPKSGLDKKRDDLKNQRDNKPKPGKDSKPGLKDKGKNFGKNLGNNLKNGAKNKAMNALNNSKVGQAVNKAADTVKKAKKTVEVTKKAGSVIKFLASPAGIYTMIGVCCFILIIILISVIVSFLPNLGGSVEDAENYSKYSTVDQETIGKLKEISEKHPTGDPSYAMVATLYPYIDELQGGNVNSLRGKSNEEQTDDDESDVSNNNQSENNQNSNNQQDDKDLEKDENELAEDDPYLELLRKRKYRKKFERLLKESEAGEEALSNHLKNDYFKKDAGYKDLFSGVDNEEELADAIIDDLLSLKGDFIGYFYENCNTANASTTSLNAAGNIGDIKGSIYVTLRDYYSTRSDGTFEDKDTAKGKFIKDDYYKSPVLYGTDTEPLTFARYIMGVAYAEHELCLNSESCAKSLMVITKSYSLGRQSFYDKEILEDKTIIHMRGNVGDQDFCDVYEGCEVGKYSKDTWSVWKGEGHSNRKGPLAKDKLENLEKWWNDISDQYVTTKEDSKFIGSHYSDYNDKCIKGNCASQTRLLKASEHEADYMNLLFNPDNGGFDNNVYTLYNSDTNELYAVTTGGKVCSNGELTGSRQSIVNFAVSMVGKIPYYFYEGQSDNYGALGHALSKNFDDNHFGEQSQTYKDHSNRDKYGLDCSGFVDFVFWNILDDNLGNGNTDTLKSKSTKIEFSELKPGDLGFLNDGSSGTEQHVGIYVGNDEWIELNPSGVTKGPYPNFKVYYRLNILAELDAKESSGDGIATGSFSTPISGKTLSCNDYPNYGSGSYHGGTDISINNGTEVLAVDGGVVEKSEDLIGCNGGRCVNGYYSYGRYIVINHNDGISTLYAHLSERLVQPGETVSKGQLIGLSGENGNTTGPHLHFEVRKNGERQNPCNYFK